MVMSNFIDETERHAELYGAYTARRRHVLEIVKASTQTTKVNDQLVASLQTHGISDAEIHWLKRTGHLLPAYR